MDSSLRPLVDSGDCRSAKLNMTSIQDVDGAEDWLRSKGMNFDAETTASFRTDTTSEPRTDGSYNSTFGDDFANELATLTPPTWMGWHLPGDRVVFTTTGPIDAVKTLHAFFEHRVPSLVKAQAWEINATVFVDYVAVGVEVKLYRSTSNASSIGGTTIVFRASFRQDIISFKKVMSSAFEHFRAQGAPLIPVGGGSAEPRPLSLMFDDDFEDGLDEPATDWSLRVTSAIEAVASPDCSAKEEGLQALASWASSQPESRMAIADAIGAHSPLVQALLSEQTPVEQLYPLAVTLKFAALHSTMPLCSQVVLGFGPGWPPIVVRELQEAYGILTNHGKSLQFPSA